MLIGYKRGQGSIVLRVKILNSSVSTGAGLTGLSSTSSGLIISTIADTESTATAYTVAASNVETITTNGTYAAPTSGKCRFKEVDATNHKGVYEIQIADARFAVSSAKSLLVSISGATNAAETDVVIPLRDLDPFDAVRAGLTALPNVASGSAGAIITSGTGTAQLSVSSGAVTVGGYASGQTPLQPTVAGRTLDVSAGGEAGIDLANVGSPNTTLSFSTTGSVGSVSGSVGSVVGAVGSIGAGGITTASFATGAIDANAMNVTGSEFTAIPWNAAWDAEVQSEVQDAIEVNHLDHLLAATYDPAAKPGAADSLFNDLVQDNGAGVTQFTTIALELAPSGGGGGTTDWTANERTAIRSILGIPTSGTTPTDPTSGILDTIRDTFPANFAALGINSSGHLSRVTLVDTCTTNTDMRGTDNAALAASWTATRAGYLDSVLIAANANQRTVQVNGNGHVASVLHSSEPDSIVVGAFAAGAIDAAALASDAATEIATATLGATVEGSETLVQVLRLVRASTVGKSSGFPSGPGVFRDAADTKARITATFDADGNRTNVTTDAT